ncbi:hypothetical protein B0H12DRAFT_1298948 [Mycena haematopus]|nr:hypothetical protein B0H12DRAFT_1298948 [Mycena haematopus]
MTLSRLEECSATRFRWTNLQRGDFSRPQGSKTSRPQDLKTSRLQDLKTSRLQDLKTSRPQRSGSSPLRGTQRVPCRVEGWLRAGSSPLRGAQGVPCRGGGRDANGEGGGYTLGGRQSFGCYCKIPRLAVDACGREHNDSFRHSLLNIWSNTYERRAGYYTNPFPGPLHDHCKDTCLAAVVSRIIFGHFDIPNGTTIHSIPSSSHSSCDIKTKAVLFSTSTRQRRSAYNVHPIHQSTQQYPPILATPRVILVPPSSNGVGEWLIHSKDFATSPKKSSFDVDMSAHSQRGLPLFWPPQS